MNKARTLSENGFPAILAQILEVAKSRGIEQRVLAERAGITAETLSRMKKRKSGDFAILDRLAQVLGFRLALVPDDATLQAIREGSFF